MLLTVTRLAVAAATPLAPDEAYYWVWSRALAPGYLDHPPMVALWIAAGTTLLGDGPLGVRLLGPLTAALGSVLLVQAGNDLLPGCRRAGLIAATLLNATLLFGIGSVTMTPDTPLLFFWTATLWALGRLLATNGASWWLVAGVAFGCALDSKYTAFLLAPAALAWLLYVPSLRSWLTRPGPWLAGAVALALFTPVLAWNAAHGWASFARQGGRAGDWHPARALQFVGELVGGQIGLATPLLAVLFAAGIARACRVGWSAREAGWTLLATTTLLPTLVFVEHALGDRVQANWPSILYPSAAVAAAGLGTWWSRLRVPAVVLGAAMTLLVWLQGAVAPLHLPRHVDPTLMRVGGWQELADAIRSTAQRDGADYVVSDNYGHAALLARLLPASLPVLGVDPRWALFSLPDGSTAVAGRPGLLVRSARRDDAPDRSDWSVVERLGSIDRSRGGDVAESFSLYRVVGRATGDAAGAAALAVMPRPR